MSRYVMNFGTFELGGAELADLTTHVLEVRHPDHEQVALVVFKKAIPEGGTLRELVAGRVADEMVRLAGYAVLSDAEVPWGGALARDVATRWRHEGRVLYGRQAHVELDATWIAFAMSAPFESRDACDAWFDEIMQSFTPT
ncbi:MAG TPA: DcrB-related protein [Minicystis sp.]|nr:DcrB-related protein [Minicystis sp.]